MQDNIQHKLAVVKDGVLKGAKVKVINITYHDEGDIVQVMLLEDFNHIWKKDDLVDLNRYELEIQKENIQ